MCSSQKCSVYLIQISVKVSNFHSDPSKVLSSIIFKSAQIQITIAGVHFALVNPLSTSTIYLYANQIARSYTQTARIAARNQ